MFKINLYFYMHLIASANGSNTRNENQSKVHPDTAFITTK